MFLSNYLVNILGSIHWQPVEATASVAARNGYNLAREAAGNNEKSAQAAELVGPEAVMISDESTAID